MNYESIFKLGVEMNRSRRWWYETKKKKNTIVFVYINANYLLETNFFQLFKEYEFHVVNELHAREVEKLSDE